MVLEKLKEENAIIALIGASNNKEKFDVFIKFTLKIKF